MVCYFGGLKEGSKSVQVLSNGIETIMVISVFDTSETASTAIYLNHDDKKPILDDLGIS